MGWNLSDKIEPPSPQTEKYSDLYQEVMGHPQAMHGSTNSATNAIGSYWNKRINPGNNPPFSAEEFANEYEGLFEESFKNYQKSQSGSPGPYVDSSVTWDQQGGGSRGGMNRDFVTETEQDFETFALDAGIDISAAIQPAVIGNIWNKKWELGTGGGDNIDTEAANLNDDDISAFTDMALIYPSNTGAELAYSQAQEDNSHDISQADEDALDTLSNTMEDLDRQQQDQQRQFIEDLRTGRAGGGLTGVRTGRNFRRSSPAASNITLQRERARQEYDQAIDRSVDKAGRVTERSSVAFNNDVADAWRNLKNNLINRVHTFKTDDIEDELEDSGMITEVLRGGAGSNAPWPGGNPCDAGKTWDKDANEGAGGCV